MEPKKRVLAVVGEVIGATVIWLFSINIFLALLVLSGSLNAYLIWKCWLKADKPNVSVAFG